jgi:hypothetical protein
MSKSPAINPHCQSSDSNTIVCVKFCPDDYCQMAISTRKLVRYDDRAVGLRGLKDITAGECFFVHEMAFFRPGLMRIRPGRE